MVRAREQLLYHWLGETTPGNGQRGLFGLALRPVDELKCLPGLELALNCLGKSRHIEWVVSGVDRADCVAPVFLVGEVGDFGLGEGGD